MIDRLKTLAVAGAVVAAMSTVPASAAAQSDLDVSLSGGYTLPLGDIADGWDNGINLGAAFSFWLQDNLAIRVDGSLDALKGTGVGERAGTDNTFNDFVPDVDLYYASGGIEFSLTDRAESDLAFLVNVGGGMTWFKSSGISGGGIQSPSFDESYFHAKGGAEVGYMLADQVDIGLQAQVYATFADEADTGFFSEFRPAEGLSAFSTTITMPISAVIRIKF